MYNVVNYTKKGISLKLNFRRGGAFASKKAHEYLDEKNPQDIQKITVIRHAAIGDFVVMRPFLIELRKFFPNAKITLSVVKHYMYGLPYDLIDEIHIMRRYQEDGKKTGLFQRISEAKTLPAQDIIFDLTDSALTHLLLFFSQAQLKIGYPYRGAMRLFYDICTLRSDFVLETQSMLHQLNVLGANTQHYPLDYQLTTVSRNVIEPYIVYFAGASVPDRCWEKTKFIKLIEQTIQKYPDYKHVILKGIKKDEHFDEIYGPLSKYKNVIHHDSMSLKKIYDYLGAASLVVAGDTGIRNMAIASNTPTLGLMWAPHISPLRYLPKVQEHQVVFNTDFIQPSVDDVYENAIKMIDKLYEK